MGPIWLRASVAAAFVAIWVAPYCMEAASLGETEGGELPEYLDVALLVVYGLLTLATGAVVGWPAPGLPVVIYLLLTPLGVHPEDSDGWTYAALYAIGAGWFSVIALLVGWATRVAVVHRSRRSPPASLPLAVLLIPSIVAVAVGGFIGALAIAANGTETEAVALDLRAKPRNPPPPDARALRLNALGYDTCGSGEDRLASVEVEGSATEVRILAEVEVQREFPCEREPGRLPLVAALDAPLGARTVIDASREKVIWP